MYQAKHDPRVVEGLDKQPEPPECVFIPKRGIVGMPIDSGDSKRFSNIAESIIYGGYENIPPGLRV